MRGRILLAGTGLALLSLILLLNPGTLVLIEGAAEWDQLKTHLHEKYPRLSRVEPAELAEWLAEETRIQPLLVDVRSRDEYEISHLDGAALVEPGSSIAESFAGIGKNQPIVLYCSVGHRSSYMARKLMRKGFSRVFHLEGSIFAWVNRGFPVYRDGIQVEEVHPYNRKWGKLLDDRLHPEKQS